MTDKPNEDCNPGAAEDKPKLARGLDYAFVALLLVTGVATFMGLYELMSAGRTGVSLPSVIYSAVVVLVMTLLMGFSAEVAAVIAENIPECLKAPVKRIGFPECPSPVSKALEDIFFPSYKDIAQASYGVLKRKSGIDIPNLQVADSFKGPY